MCYHLFLNSRVSPKHCDIKQHTCILSFIAQKSRHAWALCSMLSHEAAVTVPVQGSSQDCNEHKSQASVFLRSSGPFSGCWKPSAPQSIVLRPRVFAVFGQTSSRPGWGYSPHEVSVRSTEGPVEHGPSECGCTAWLLGSSWPLCAAFSPSGDKQDLFQNGGLLIYYQTREIRAFLHDQL